MTVNNGRGTGGGCDGRAKHVQSEISVEQLIRAFNVRVGNECRPESCGDYRLPRRNKLAVVKGILGSSQRDSSGCASPTVNKVDIPPCDTLHTVRTNAHRNY